MPSYSSAYFDSGPLSVPPWSEGAKTAIVARAEVYQASGMMELAALNKASGEYGDELSTELETYRPEGELAKGSLAKPGTLEADVYTENAMASGMYPQNRIEAGRAYWEEYLRQVEGWKALRNQGNDPSRSDK